MTGNGIQSAVRAACSVTYLSDKLGVSRPTLYKYMELYDAGESARLPAGVRDFFGWLTAAKRGEDDVIMYFVRRPRGPEAPEKGRCLCGGGRAMVVLTDVPDPSKAVVEVLIPGRDGLEVIGEYRPEPGRRFVTIGDLVPGHTFYFRVRDGSGAVTEPEPFDVGSDARGGDAR